MIEITLDEIKTILGEEFIQFHRITHNAFCSACGNAVTTITKYKANIDSQGNIILNGFCIRCGHKVGRLIETSEDPNQRERAFDLIKTHKLFENETK